MLKEYCRHHTVTVFPNKASMQEKMRICQQRKKLKNNKGPQPVNIVTKAQLSGTNKGKSRARQKVIGEKGESLEHFTACSLTFRLLTGIAGEYETPLEAFLANLQIL